MSATIELAGVFRASISDARVWRVTAEDPILRDSVERSLNAEYGIDWTPAFGEYVPSFADAAAIEAAEDLGAVVTEITPGEDLPENAIP